jgi:serine/threonine-protein kinase RsbW/sigma-B regulation protein RsbU (phosphoserine phosphatase)
MTSANTLLDYWMPSQAEAIEELSYAVQTALADLQEHVFPINLCLEELIFNTISYGLKGDSTHRFHVRIIKHPQELEITIEDDGPSYDPFAHAILQDPNLSVDERPIGGLGIHFVKTLMTEVNAVQLNPGNRITLHRRI